MRARLFFLVVRSLLLVATIAHLLGGIAAQSAWAVISLNANFDSASLCLVGSSACDDTNVPSSVNGNTVSLVGRDNFNNGDWKWVYFQASGVAGQQVTFEIGDDFETGSSNLIGHKFVYSYDQVNWSFFDNNQLSTSQHKFVFSNNTPFSQDSVFVAYGLPYPYQQTVDQVAGLVGSPWVSPTASGNSSLVIGQSPGGVDDTGRAIAPHDLYGFKISDADAVGPKKRIVLVGGVHANETVGNWTLDGLVDFLISDDLRAAQLRRYAEFYVYPMVNPDGRYAGNNRTTIAVNDVDPNRGWNPPSYTEPGDSSSIAELAIVGEAMRTDTGGDVDYLVDFHSTVNHSIPYHYGYILPQWQNNPFWLSVKSREPGVLTGTALLNDFTAAKFGRDELQAEFSATFETLFIAGENIGRFLSLGRNFGLAWHDVLSVFADLNFDGSLDPQDWLIFNAAMETNLSSLSAIERYAHGDLNGDGRNDIADFALFKQQYISLQGAAAFAALFQKVPEASTCAIAVIGLLSGSLGLPRVGRRPCLLHCLVTSIEG